MLPLGGLHVKHAVQRGIWVPTQHLHWDQEKPRETLIELVGRVSLCPKLCEGWKCSEVSMIGRPAEMQAVDFKFKFLQTAERQVPEERTLMLIAVSTSVSS
jgi:hypothetical protein